MKILRKYWEIAVIGILSLVPFLWLSNGQIILGHDSGFRLDPMGQMSTLFYSWYTKFNFGMDLSLYKGFLVIQSPEAFFTFLTGSLTAGQQLTCFLYFFLMGFSMYVLMKTVFPDPQYWILRLYTSIFYMYNFFILQGWFIAERAKFSIYAALPLFIAVLHSTFIKKVRVSKALFFTALISFFLNAGGSPPLFIPILTAVILAYGTYFFWYLSRNGRAGLWFCLKIGVFFAMTHILVNLYWIVPLLDLYTRNYSSAIATQGGIEGILSWERMISKNASFLNIIRLQGIPDWYDNTMHPYANEFLRNPVLIAASFMPICFVFLGCILKIFQKKWKENPMILYVCMLLPIGIFFSMGTHPPFGIVYEKLLRYLPGFTVFRSSFYKFAPFVWFSMIILSGVTIHELITQYIKKRFLIILLGMAMCLAVLLYHYPYFTRDIFSFADGFTTRLTIPSYVRETIDYMNTNIDPNAQMLLLPELNTGYYGKHLDTYTWGYFSIELLPRESHRTVLANDDGSPEIITSLYQLLYRNDKKAFVDTATLLGVRYILWRGDVRNNSAVVGLQGPMVSKEIIRAFGFPLVFKSGNWEIYDIGQTARANLIQVYPNIHVSHVNHFTTFNAWVKNVEDPTHTAVLTGASENLQKDITGISERIIYEPECMLCADGEFDKTIDSLTLPGGDSLVRRFRARVFSLDETKQILAEQRPSKKIDLQLSFMTRTLAQSQNGQTTSSYLGSLDDISRQLEKLRGVEKNKYLIRVLLFLTFHQRELEKMNENPEITKKVAEAISRLSTEAQFTKQKGVYTYVIDLPEDKEYSLFLDGSLQSIEIDGVNWHNNTSLALKSGFHALTLPVALSAAPIIQIWSENSTVEKPGFPDIRYERMNPVWYRVHVENAQRPFVLSLGQQFDPGWVTDVTDKHVEVNGYANGWLVDKKGTYDVVISYKPQEKFYAGFILSGIALMCIALQALYFWKKEGGN